MAIFVQDYFQRIFCPRSDGTMSKLVNKLLIIEIFYYFKSFQTTDTPGDEVQRLQLELAETYREISQRVQNVFNIFN